MVRQQLASLKALQQQMATLHHSDTVHRIRPRSMNQQLFALPMAQQQQMGIAHSSGTARHILAGSMTALASALQQAQQQQMAAARHSATAHRILAGTAAMPPVQSSSSNSSSQGCLSGSVCQLAAVMSNTPQSAKARPLLAGAGSRKRRFSKT
jgi:hypothetical protein